jgi:hypothetical protein
VFPIEKVCPVQENSKGFLKETITIMKSRISFWNKYRWWWCGLVVRRIKAVAIWLATRQEDQGGHIAAEVDYMFDMANKSNRIRRGQGLEYLCLNMQEESIYSAKLFTILNLCVTSQSPMASNNLQRGSYLA